MEKKVKISFIVLLFTYFTAFSGYLSIFIYISFLERFLFLFTFLLGTYFDIKGRHPIPRLYLNITAVSASIFYLFKVNLSDPVLPVVEILLLLLGIKLLEEKRVRDFMQIYLISVLLLAGAALLDISILFLIFFIFILFSTILSFVFLTYYNLDKDISISRTIFVKILLRISLIPVFVLPLTLILFFLLPRSQYPIFDFLNREKISYTGFTDKVSPGDVSKIQEDSSVVLRIKMEKLPQKELYWRGAVLNFFDGQSWLRKPVKTEEFLEGGKYVKQHIIKEPSISTYLFGLNVPFQYKNIRYIKFPDFVFTVRQTPLKRLSYTVFSKIGGELKAEEIDNIYLQLPDKIKNDKSLLQLAKNLKGKTPEETLENIKNFFKDFSYTNSSLPTNEPLKTFLFKEKRGNCEFFASSTGVLLRLNGIPSRLVTGYMGGEYNKIANYYIISNKDAHVWAEAFINGIWITVDTTPTYSNLFNKSDNNLKLLIDTINYLWISAVINFNFEKQLETIKLLKHSIKLPEINADKRYVAIFIINFIIFFSMVAYFLYKKYEVKFYLYIFLKKLEKKGYFKGKGEGLLEFVNKIEDKVLHTFALEFVNEILDIIYKDKKLDKDKRKKIRKLMKNL